MIKLDQKVRIGNFTYKVRGLRGCGWFMCNIEGPNSAIFEELGIANKDRYVSDIVGYSVGSGNFPYLNTLEDLTKVVADLQSQYGERVTMLRKDLLLAHNAFDCITIKEGIKNILNKNPLKSDEDSIVIPAEYIKRFNKEASSDQKEEAAKYGYVSLEDEETYCMGDRFKLDDGEEYLLAQVAPNMVSLISLNSGYRYRDTIKVYDPHSISKEELMQMASEGVSCTYKTDYYIKGR